MKRMDLRKKVLALVLCVAMVLTSAACGGERYSVVEQTTSTTVADSDESPEVPEEDVPEADASELGLRVLEVARFDSLAIGSRNLDGAITGLLFDVVIGDFDREVGFEVRPVGENEDGNSAVSLLLGERRIEIFETDEIILLGYGGSAGVRLLEIEYGTDIPKASVDFSADIFQGDSARRRGDSEFSIEHLIRNEIRVVVLMKTEIFMRLVRLLLTRGIFTGRLFRANNWNSSLTVRIRMA